MAGDIDELTRLVAAFRDARDWSQFHSLRNLIVSLNLEAGAPLRLFLHTQPLSPLDGELLQVGGDATTGRGLVVAKVEG